MRTEGTRPSFARVATVRTILALVLAAADATSSAAQGAVEFDLILDARLVTTPNGTSFFDGGLGKTRYGARPRAVEAKIGQAIAVATWRPALTVDVGAQINVDAERDLGRRIDLVEARVRWQPALTSALGLDLRAGLFFPSLSVENTELGWLSPHTVSFSAINAWVGEEVRSIGFEGGPVIQFGETFVRPWASYTTRNDPSGTLLAWRGFAVHDRVTAIGDRIPLAPLRAFARPDLFPDQARWVEPVREVDDRWTWAAGADVRGPTFRARAMIQPETADKTAFDGEQYAWRTGYVSLGGSVSIGPLELLAQGLDGVTRMGKAPSGAAAVDNRFRAAFGLAAVVVRDHRVSLRYDAFEVADRDQFRVEDPNGETGSAWTFAYVAPLHEKAKLFVEVLRVDSTRTNRADLGQTQRQIETLGTLALRLTF